MWASIPGLSGALWTARKIAAGSPGGSPLASSAMAVTPPADAPMTMMSRPAMVRLLGPSSRRGQLGVQTQRPRIHPTPARPAGQYQRTLGIHQRTLGIRTSESGGCQVAAREEPEGLEVLFARAENDVPGENR